MSELLSEDLVQLYRAESSRIVAALMYQCRDLALVEDAVQDAYLQACQQWPERGAPDNRVAWLHSVAKRRLIDRLRHERVRRSPVVQHELLQRYQWRYAETQLHMSIPDDRLRLIFSCCHPSLSQQAQVALTLKVICGLSSGEIARAYLISEDTLNRRLTRAKQKIALAGIAYEVPEGEALQQRLPAVLATIYLLFNESYHAAEGPELTRDDLALESIRLGRLLYELQPTAEAGGLLALMELHWARRPGRNSDELAYIPLEAQDRSRWDRLAIERSSQFLYSLMSEGDVGMYQIQAAISALHARAANFDSVDWQQIAGLYEVLYRCMPTPVIRLHYWVARSYVAELSSVLDGMEELAQPLASYQPFHAARADVARRAKLIEQAAASYEAAIALSQNSAAKDFLQRRLQALQR